MLRPTTRFLALGLALVLSPPLFAAETTPPPAAPAPAARPAVAAILDELSTAVLREFPEYATLLAVGEAQAGGPYAARLTDGSPAAVAARVTLFEGFRKRLAALDLAALPSEDAISVEVALAMLDSGLDGAPFGYGDYGFGGFSPYPVSQLTGAYLDMPDFLDSMHPVESVAGADAYLARLAGFERVLDEETAGVRADAEKGVIPPAFVLEGAIRQLEAFAAKAPGETVLVTSLRRRAAEIPGLAAETAADYAARAEGMVREQVLPAYRRQAAALGELLPRASAEPGVWRLPRGADYYAASLQAQTTTHLTPEEIHELGLKLVAGLRLEIDRGLTAQGIPPGPLAERLHQVAKLPGQLYPDTDEGRAALLADLNHQCEAIEARMPEVFGLIPKARVEIKRVPVYAQAGAPGGYYQPAALDGSRPGAYYINLRDLSEWPRYTLPTLSYHEATPGHHMQISIQQELAGLPFFRTALAGFNAYAEGWALYAEQMVDEMGVYGADPFGRIGYLQSALFRAARLVVDTGIHHKRWSRDQAIDYMVETTGDQRSSMVTEVERYAVWPGQATTYMVGRESILRLRERARAELGAAFDLKAFHDLVLGQGSVPLTTLERETRAWIAARKTAAAGS